MSKVTATVLPSSKLALDKNHVTAECSAETTATNPIKALHDVCHPASHLPLYEVVDGCCTWHWTDSMSGAEGWIVIDSPTPLTSGGGLFLHAGATLDEVRDVARSMSAKLAVSSQPQICGAKGGIRFPSEHPDASLVLERFIRDNAGVISQYWGTGGDLNTNHEVIDKHARAYCYPGTSTALDALYLTLNPKSSPSSSFSVHDLLGEPVGDTPWSLSQYSVGYVMAIVLRELLAHTKPDLLGKVRLVVQGFGCVGSTFTHAVKRLGLGRVVAISSQYGFYVDKEGIDCDAIEYRRHLEAGLTEHQLQSDLYTKRRAGSSDEDHLADFFAATDGEAFVPCAGRYILGPKALSALFDGTFRHVPHGARFVLAGANNVLGQSETKHEILSRLDSKGVIMVPEWVSNSGTSNLFMRACSGLALDGYGASTLEACANDSSAFINKVFSNHGKNAGTTGLWEACENLAVARRQAGAVNLLGVKRMSHLTLSTPNVARASQTVTQVYNASVSPDGALYQLPGLGDPTLSIIQAPQSAGPRDIGISVHFSVYSLEKARGVLEAEDIAFKERTLNGGSLELVLSRETAGYPISLRQVPAFELPEYGFFRSGHVLSSVVGATGQVDHYAAVMPDSARAKRFHETMLGFTALRTFTVKAGADAQSDDGLMHVMALPSDTSRSMVLTEGLSEESIFTKLMKRHDGPYLHHLALQVDDVDAVFRQVRDRGWQTTAEEPSYDLATGLRQFFLREDETGCIFEFIDRRKNDQGGYGDSKAEFGVGNIVALAQSLDDSLN